MSTDIVLATFNARYTHASMGLRCLRANLGPYRERSEILEATVGLRPLLFVEQILARRPKIVGLGVYVWNARESLHLVRLLKAIAPEVVVVLGGPEVSHELEAQEICTLADFVVRGEGEVAFARLCTALLGRGLVVAPAKIIDGLTSPPGELVLPYDEYDDRDLRERTIYIEASRGCPFRCAFCLSALDRGVRAFPLEVLLAALGRLHDRGLRRFKFVDRTFNLAIADAVQILEFFLRKGASDLFLHFEMIPDRLPEPLLRVLEQFPAGAIQLELGFQTFDPRVAARIARRTHIDDALENVRKLRTRTGAHVHADLIAGLPDETWESFAAGFDLLVDAGPQEIQLGLLKRLRGAPLWSSKVDSGAVFDEEPPYEVLRTPTLDFSALAQLRRIAWVWDRVFNQGRAPHASGLAVETWRGRGSVFAGLAQLTAEVAAREGVLHAVPWERLFAHLRAHLLALGIPEPRMTEAFAADVSHGKANAAAPGRTRDEGRSVGPPSRQRRHLRGRVEENGRA